jgi:polyisoprenoid-binding protein YceI
VFALTLVRPLPAAAQTVEWTIDSSHSAAQFAVRHMMVSTVRGRLGKASGIVRFDGKNPASIAIDATIDVTGIDTQEPRRDEDLRSANFFDVQKFPTATFKSKRSEAAGAGRFNVIGDLTMHGVTKEVVLEVEGPSLEIRQGATRRIGATATARINRSDFSLTWNRAIETGGVVVGDEVSITLDVEIVRKADAIDPRLTRVRRNGSAQP